MTDLEYTNHQVLCFVQASLGAISANMRFVSLVTEGKAARFRFLLEEESARDREEIDDLLTEYFALRDTGTEGECHADVQIVGNCPLESLDRSGRAIYIRQESAPKSPDEDSPT